MPVRASGQRTVNAQWNAAQGVPCESIMPLRNWMRSPKVSLVPATATGVVASGGR
jgi:hypothetical protein